MPTASVTADACQYIVEPPGLWRERVSAKHREKAPKVVAMPDGGEGWAFEGGAWLRPLGLEAAAGLAPVRDHGYSYSSIAKGAADAKERLKAMDADGVDVASVFPSYGLEIRFIEDPELHVACVEAYNDGVLEWARSGNADRLIPHALIPATGLDAAMAELRRVAKMGFKGIVFPGWPKGGDIPDLDEDSFWSACAETGLVVNLVRGGQTGADRTPTAPNRYIGSNGSRVRAVDLPPAQVILQSVIANPTVLHFMAGAGVLDRNPDLKVAQIDNGAGWVACAWEGMDWQHRYSQYMKIWPPLKRRPSDYIQAQVKATVKNEKSAIEARHDIGVHMLMWASSYPASTSTWPRSQAVIDSLLNRVPDAERRKILGENFLELYGLSVPRRMASAKT